MTQPGAAERHIRIQIVVVGKSLPARGQASLLPPLRERPVARLGEVKEAHPPPTHGGGHPPLPLPGLPPLLPPLPGGGGKARPEPAHSGPGCPPLGPGPLHRCRPEAPLSAGAGALGHDPLWRRPAAPWGGEGEAPEEAGALPGTRRLLGKDQGQGPGGGDGGGRA